MRLRSTWSSDLPGLTIFFGSKGAGNEAGSPASKPFRDSIVVEVLNPKTALFFLTFLPQFVQPEADIALWLQFLILGVVVNLVFSIADVAAVVIASFALGGLSGSKVGWLVDLSRFDLVLPMSCAVVWQLKKRCVDVCRGLTLKMLTGRNLQKVLMDCLQPMLLQRQGTQPDGLSYSIIA
jgi:hypothetical protein